MKQFLPLFLYLLLLTPAHSFELQKFETDNCTMFVEGTRQHPDLWQHCCLMHDFKYWFGGSNSDRDKADFDLKKCVEVVAGEKWSTIIYSGVRLGHYSPIKNKYKWAWGWIPPRKMTNLSLEEKEYAFIELLKLNFNQKYIVQTIREYSETSSPSVR